MPGRSADPREVTAWPRDGAEGVVIRLADHLGRFFSGPGFPVFALVTLGLYQLGLMGLLFVPRADTGLGAFAEDFRLWCLGMDAATGRTNWGYAWGMITPPAFVMAAIAWLWRGALEPLRRRRAPIVRPAIAGLAVVAIGAGGLVLYAPRGVPGEQPFPARELRTSHDPPPLSLTDQEGAPIALAELRGKVVLLTGVYASCNATCPMILSQAKRVVTALQPRERADVRVLAVTLDPDHDSREVLSNLAAAQGLSTPTWHFLTGAPADVERTLDRIGVSRSRDPATGRIDHANLFLLLDRKGRVAYRFTLGPRQESWLSEAMRLLLRESADVG